MWCSRTSWHLSSFSFLHRYFAITYFLNPSNSFKEILSNYWSHSFHWSHSLSGFTRGSKQLNILNNYVIHESLNQTIINNNNNNNKQTLQQQQKKLWLKFNKKWLIAFNKQK
jgi:hypothetical protein